MSMFRLRVFCLSAGLMVLLWGADQASSKETLHTAKGDNFKALFPNEVEVNRSLASRTYSCQQTYRQSVFGVDVSEVTTYMITVFPTKPGQTPNTILQEQIEDIQSRLPKLKVLSTTPITCSGYQGVQASCAASMRKPGERRSAFAGMLGSDFRVLEVGSKTYLFQVVYMNYEPGEKSPFTYSMLPDSSWKFFRSFKILDSSKVKPPVAPEVETIGGAWDVKVGRSWNDWSFLETDSVVHVRSGRRVRKTSYNISEGTPMQIDIGNADSPKNMQKGIYKFEEGKLVLCLGKMGSTNRPTSFEESEQSEVLRMSRPGHRILSKIVPAKQEPTNEDGEEQEQNRVEADHSSPEAVFNTHVQATLKRDWVTELNCWTPDSQSVLLAQMILEQNQLATKLRDIPSEQLNSIGIGQRASDWIELFDQTVEKHGIAPSNLSPIKLGLEENGVQKFMDSIAPTVKDKPACFAELRILFAKGFPDYADAAFGKADEVKDWKLSDLTLEGDRANGRSSGKLGGKMKDTPIRFKKIGDRWFIIGSKKEK